MKYAGRAGHNPLCEGADALINEVAEDRKIFYASKKYLSLVKDFIDVTPNPVTGQNNDLNYGIKLANDNNVDIFYSVHLNKAYDKYEGEIGCEIWLYDTDSKLVLQATRILENLESLGFKNRGIKYASIEKKQLAELSNTKMPAMIIECFFIEATKDVELYRKLGAEIIGKAIAEGFTGKSISIPTPAAAISKPSEVKLQVPTSGTVTADVLNVRSGPGTNYKIIGKLSKGSKVKIASQNGNWYDIYFGNHGGYVSSDYIK